VQKSNGFCAVHHFSQFREQAVTLAQSTCASTNVYLRATLVIAYYP
jgi:hypothetical protein